MSEEVRVEAEEEETLPEKESPRRPKPAPKQGRPHKWLSWRCDKYPNLNVLIPEWLEDDKLALKPYAEFLGSRLDTKQFAEYRGLDSDQVDQMNEILEKTKFVRLESEVKGATYFCDFCGQVCASGTKLGQHMILRHKEELDVAR